jgi:hypothetical protein
MAKTPNDYDSNRNSPRSKILFYPDDPPEFYLLIMQLIKDKYYVTRASKHQIKHREVNYYPSSGVITIDGEGRHPEKGPQALLKLLEKRYPRRRSKGDDTQATPQEPSPSSPPSSLILDIDLDDLDTSGGYDPVPSDSWDDAPW